MRAVECCELKVEFGAPDAKTRGALTGEVSADVSAPDRRRRGDTSQHALGGAYPTAIARSPSQRCDFEIARVATLPALMACDHTLRHFHPEAAPRRRRTKWARIASGSSSVIRAQTRSML